jgi:hypothetical protein
LEGFLAAAAGVESFVMLAGNGFHLLVADAARMVEQGAFVEFEQAVR